MTGPQIHPPPPGAYGGFGPHCLPGMLRQGPGKGTATFLEKVFSHCSRLAETKGSTRAGRRTLLMSLVSEWMKFWAPSPEKGGEGESRSVSSTDILWLGQAMLTGG